MCVRGEPLARIKEYGELLHMTAGNTRLPLPPVLSSSGCAIMECRPTLPSANRRRPGMKGRHKSKDNDSKGEISKVKTRAYGMRTGR